MDTSSSTLYAYLDHRTCIVNIKEKISKVTIQQDSLTCGPSSAAIVSMETRPCLSLEEVGRPVREDTAT